jgi:hypothetical protein
MWRMHCLTKLLLCFGRGGNMTITGVKVQVDSATVNTSLGDAAPTNSSTPVLRQRSAALNGSLGFYTLGLSIEVLGDFALQRYATHSVLGPCSCE